LQQKLQAMPSLPTGFPSVMPSVITLDITDGYTPSVMFPRETFFWRVRIRRWFRRWVFFLFATELATEMGFTDDCYTDGRDPSVTPSVLLLPTECIDVTDGISPSAKLYNVVVYNILTCLWCEFYVGFIEYIYIKSGVNKGLKIKIQPVISIS
jgi:hypothetical protein